MLDKLLKVLRVLKYVVCTVIVLALVGGLVWLAVNVGPTLYNYMFRAETIDGFRLIPDGDVAVVTDYTGGERIATIPAELNGLPVTKVYAPGEGGKLIRELTIPDCMQITEESMIWYFVSVDRLYVSDTHPDYISIDGILYSRDGKTLVCCPVGRLGTVTIPEGVERIGTYAFLTPFVTEIVIPESVRVIEPYAFSGCKNLSPLTVPPTVETVESEAFETPEGLPELRLIVTEGSAAAQAAAEYGWVVEQVLPAAQN